MGKKVEGRYLEARFASERRQVAHDRVGWEGEKGAQKLEVVGAPTVH